MSKGQVIAIVADPLGSSETELVSSVSGMVIGRTNLPLVCEGDAVFHMAAYGRKVRVVEQEVERFQEAHEAEIGPDTGQEATDAAIT